MRVGAFVKLIDGPYKGRYGKVVSMNGDLGRVTLQWALGIYGKGAEVNEIFTELVTSAEYEKRGKDITKQTANGHTDVTEPQDDAYSVCERDFIIFETYSSGEKSLRRNHC